MTKEEKKLKTKVYERTSLYACMCFDNPEEVNKAQEFLCVLMKRGVIAFVPEEVTVE